MKNFRRFLCALLAIMMLTLMIPAYATEEPVDVFDDELEDGMIDVEVVNIRVADPVIGEKPAATASVSTIPEGALEIDKMPVEWSVLDEYEGFIPMDEEAVFEKGLIYRASVNINDLEDSHAEGYFIITAEIDFNECDYFEHGGAIFGPLGMNVISSIEVTVDEPQLGVAPATTATVKTAAEGALTADTVTIPGWFYLYSEEEPKPIPEDGEEPVEEPGEEDPGEKEPEIPDVGIVGFPDIDFENIDIDAILADTGLGAAMEECGLLNVFNALRTSGKLREIADNYETISAQLEALGEDATPQATLDILGIPEDVVTGDQLQEMLMNLSFENVDMPLLFEMLGFDIPVVTPYVTEFEYGGYYLPDVRDAINDILADGYAVNPLTTEYVFNGNEQKFGWNGFGPVGFEEIKTVELELNDKVGGVTVELPGYDPENEEADWYWENQTNRPEFSGDGVSVNDSGFWYADKEYSAPFIGAFKCGDPYYTDVNIRADYGYYLASDVTVTVNGKALKPFDDSDSGSEEPVTDAFSAYGRDIYVRVSGTVQHDWGERVLTGKDGDNNVFTYTCKACGETKTEKLPAFTDVVEGAFYEKAVEWAVLNGVTAGTSPTTFSPSNNCTRSQVVTFLWRAAGSPEPTSTECPFTDVKTDAFYYKAMLWAVENKVTNGMTATTFAPNKTCTRGQVVTFLWRAAGSPEPTKTEHPFTDVSETAFYYKAMLWAVENKVTNGMTATTFAPGKTCTRGQVVTFLYRACEQA